MTETLASQLSDHLQHEVAVSNTKSMLPAVLTLQERVRRFNLGTPTPMHMDTHYLVNDLWRANADMLAALQFYADAQNYKQIHIPSRGFSVSENSIDGGKRARAALAKAEPSA